MAIPRASHEVAAAEVRAELARQQISQSRLALALGMTEVSMSRRLRAQTPFDVNELVAIAEFLQVPVSRFLPAPQASA